MIIANDKYNMTEISSSYYSVQMRLVIRKLRKSDFGGYKCISKNSIGDAEGNIRLYEMDLPNRAKSALDREDLDNDSAPETDGEPGQHLYNGYQGSLREAGDNSVVGDPGSGEGMLEDGATPSGTNCSSRLLTGVLLALFLGRLL